MTTSLLKIWSTPLSEIKRFNHPIITSTENGAYIRASQKYAQLNQLSPYEMNLV